MTDAKSAWNETGEHLSALGSKLGAHFERQHEPDDVEEDGEKARPQANETIKKVGDAVQDAFESAGAAARDQAVRDDAKQVGRSLLGALDATVREVSAEVRKLLDRDKETPAPSDSGPSVPVPPAEPVVAEPVVVPEPVAEPVVIPESVAEPVVEPETVAQPVVVPETVAEPVVVPETVAEPVVIPEPEPVVDPAPVNEAATEDEPGANPGAPKNPS